ncbi:poly-gamma-glutamate biosynthesis protein PgsC [candidate division KSB1 bacterium]|nr:poly-gamma-glutamate biosynthesis protein PgsC [candidate division KSB1 bacterium]
MTICKGIDVIIEAIFLGILIGFIYYEVVGLTPGGIIVPGYIALYLTKPIILLTTLVVVFITYFIVKALTHVIILYGRRAFLAAVMIGFLLKWLLESVVFQLSNATFDLQIIGYIIPGLIAHDMRKQGIAETLLSTAFVSSLVFVVLRIHQHIVK